MIPCSPPPLSQMVDASKSANTPPVDLPARKIMRRGDDGKSGTNTTANSENPSKTTSEAGGSDGGNDNTGNKAKDKSAMTREEREARYREARQRIFGSAESEENESTEAIGSGEEKNTSRSSSASGKKKSKKQRNFDDDGFEARSRFNAYYTGPYPASGYSGDGTVYFSGFPGPVPTSQYTSMDYSPPPTYSNAYPGMMPQETQSQYGWPSQQYHPSSGPTMYPGYAPMQNGYDLSTDFQRGMQSFQSAGMPSQMTPKMANVPMAGYSESYQPPPQHMAMNPGWSPMNQQPQYPMAQGPFAPNGPGNRPMSAPIQGPMPGTYPYGQFPPPTYNGKPNRNQHPIPGSYQRPQFNPQSQAFVPGGRNMPFQVQPNVPGMPPQGMNGYGNFQMSAGAQMHPQMPVPSPPTGTPQTFGSPRVMHNSIPMPARPTNSNSSPSSQPTPSSQGSQQSSIAKYGTPAHLPARPPPPQPQQQAPKLNLPGHNFPVSRVASNPTPGYVSSTPQIASMRGGGGPNTNTN